MKLNVIIPTSNRAKLPAQTLPSVENAHIPSNLEIRVIVVNNNSDDETDKVVKKLQKREILEFLGFFYSRSILESRLNNSLGRLSKRTSRVAER
jgi:glycosyltransferase involved in cell wall biosynthesis